MEKPLLPINSTKDMSQVRGIGPSVSGDLGTLVPVSRYGMGRSGWMVPIKLVLQNLQGLQKRSNLSLVRVNICLPLDDATEAPPSPTK